MSAKWEKTGKTTGELTFEISQEEIKLGLDQAFNRVKKNLRVPGFRKGHVSRVIFNQYYGEEALYEDALNLVLPNAYTAAVKEAKIEAVGQPKIEPVSMDKDKAWTMKATVSVKPEVELGDYKGIEVPKQNTRVYQKDIDAELEKKREQNAELVLKDDKAAKGDTVTIDYKGTIDGKAFDGGSAENYSLELGSNTFIPGFEDQLEGHKAGDEVDVVVTFPEDYGAKDLAGKEAHFATKLHEVKSKELPKLDDEFAKDVDDSVETLDELKEKIKKQLKEDKEAAAQDAIQEAAITTAVKNAKIDEIPDAMIQEDVDTQLNQYLGNMQRQGIDPQTYFKLTNTTEQQLRAQLSTDAAERVKTNLVLEAIVAKEDLKADKKEIEQEIKDLAAEYNMDEKTVRNTLTDDMLSHDIAVRKAMDLITDSAKQVGKAQLEKDSDK
ncbi:MULTISPECIES: trigger factor [Lactobacillus]|jgi:trigger factor|uniref:Trigger factor n=2 Tax=Lactobacillus mulieris TaxID=2508708 RepID=A0AAW5WYP1_9LACO|nr:MULTISPECIES: trigger factor [Lactobacillus]EFH29275.1 trigger factor [Lactobacillus jensenii JV-V16]KAA9245338.1 trigger factor [Lactobacillus jensenii]MCF1796901.1 trigger factor [Lactobacillus mulieris]MCT7674123.1 trigger factor [Lactobacillus mulieris]MCT7772606.1 trigger factor [Lactobacillus mulieris]